MKINHSNYFGGIEGVTKLITNTTVNIGSVAFNNKRSEADIQATMEVLISINTSGTRIITLCRYTGDLHLNGGIETVGELPFQLTEGGRIVWNSFIDEVKKRTFKIHKRKLNHSILFKTSLFHI